MIVMRNLPVGYEGVRSSLSGLHGGGRIDLVTPEYERQTRWRGWPAISWLREAGAEQAETEGRLIIAASSILLGVIRVEYSMYRLAEAVPSCARGLHSRLGIQEAGTGESEVEWKLTVAKHWNLG